MQKVTVNFGAALLAAVFFTACNTAGSTPSADRATKPEASGAPAANATDAMVVAADKGRIMGDSAAKTWVIVASDFQCPYCRQWHSESYKQFVDTYVRTGKVKVAYVNFPLGQHQNAVPAAKAAMCASAQNKFWQYHDALFDSQDKWEAMPQPRAVYDSIARAVGVNFAEWGKCVDSDRMLPLIFGDRDRAAAGGVQSTPTFLVGGQVIAGAVPFADLKPVIDSAIAKNGSAPSP